ncbi:MAG: hypothetical protein FWC62_00530, partial [Firmicutes bacterium]|nr:hypothetical protein [Bacillota bacterium]
ISAKPATCCTFLPRRTRSIRRLIVHDFRFGVIFTIKDNKPFDIFGYDDEGTPIEVPWSRVGSSSILYNGLIDSTNGNFSIYKLFGDGYTVIKIASAELYDYPDMADLAEAQWRYYINSTQVDYDFYVQYLSTEGYTVNGNNPLATIDWVNLT